MELIDLWYVFLRRLWTIISIIILCIAGSFVYLYYTPKIYEAQTKLLVVENKGANLSLSDNSNQDVLLQSLGRSDPLKTQIEVLTTNPVLAKTIEFSGIIDKNGQPLSIEAFKKSLTAVTIPGTNLLSISYTNSDPIKAREVLNTLNSVFLKMSQKLNKEEAQITKKAIEEQISVQQDKLAYIEKVILDFKRRTKTVSIEKKSDAQLSTMTTLETEKKRIESELKGADAQKSLLTKNINQPDAKLTPFYTYWLTSLEQIQNRIIGLTAQLETIKDQIHQVQIDQSKQPPAEVELATLQRDEKIISQLYTNLLERLEEVKIREATKIASVRIVEPAYVLIKPVSPQKRKIIGIGFAIGLSLACICAFFLEYIRDLPSSVNDVRRILSASTLLGVIPHIKSKNKLISLIVSETINESISHLFANLKLKGLTDGDKQAVLVTSACKSEGKSLVSANLALAFAYSHKKTVLVSFDLRKCSLGKVFNKTFSKGVIDYFNGDVALDQIIYTDSSSNLKLIPAGASITNPLEFVLTKKIQKFLVDLKELFDIVIVDSAPILIGSETLELGRIVDNIFLTVSMRDSARGAIRTTYELFNAHKLPFSGYIVNNYKSSQWNKYGYYSKTSYGIPLHSVESVPISSNGSI